MPKTQTQSNQNLSQTPVLQTQIIAEAIEKVWDVASKVYDLIRNEDVPSFIAKCYIQNAIHDAMTLRELRNDIRSGVFNKVYSTVIGLVISRIECMYQWLDLAAAAAGDVELANKLRKYSEDLRNIKEWIIHSV